MGNNYKHLTADERDHICALRASESLGAIAKSLCRNKSTISRELKRNRSSVYNYYCSNQAQQRAKKRKQEAGKRDRLKNPDIRRYVIRKLKQDWTPELIAGKLPLDHPGLNISYEAIYQYIYDPKVRKKQDLVSCLPRAHRKRHRKGHTRKHRESHIPERVSIDQRPKIQALEKLIKPIVLVIAPALVSIEGIAEITAAQLVARVGDIDYVPSAAS